jgi:hypothetical protein
VLSFEADEIIVRRALTPEEVAEACALQARVYEESGFGEVGDIFAAFSAYYMAIHLPTGAVVGVIRLIPWTARFGLPVLEFPTLDANWLRDELPGLDLTRCAEVSALACDALMRKRYQFIIAGKLYRQIWQDTVRSDRFDHWMAAADVPLYRAFLFIWKFAFAPIGKEYMHKGSDCVPCIMNLAEGFSQLAARNPELLAFFVEGLELEYLPDVNAALMARAVRL